MSAGYLPSHPGLFTVRFGEGDFSAYLESHKAFEAGQTVTKIEGTTNDATKAYTSVQYGPREHLELNSDLRYANHSCEPNTAWDLSSPNPGEWYIRALKKIEVGDSVTFFYPSTEWDMDQPFDCHCGASTCLKKIQGAKYLSLNDVAARGWVNPWIVQLAQERDARN